VIHAVSHRETERVVLMSVILSQVLLPIERVIFAMLLFTCCLISL